MMRKWVATVVLLSVFFLIPCFWQARIQAGDFATHVYNAWLATLVLQGKISGLWIAQQWNNILFDLTLKWLLQIVGVNLAQRIAVSLAVLVFVWGAIFFIAKAAGRIDWWFVVPSVAILAYGFIYHMGFFNFYLSLGLCFWYLAIFWSAGWWLRVTVTPLLALAWLAHPLPVAWAVGMAAYIAVAKWLHSREQWLLLAGLLAILGARFILIHRYDCNWSIKQAFYVTGANQALAFGVPRPLGLAAEGKYLPLFLALLLLWLLLFWEVVRRQGFTNLMADIPFQLWALNAAGVFLIPDTVTFPQYANPLSYVSHRLSLAAAVMACAVVSTASIGTREKIGITLMAAIFFGLVYRDTLAINRMEDRIIMVVRQLPPGQRVIGVFPPRTARMNPLSHSLDRSCIGQCFSYSDYEPATRQFRVRAQPGNRVVLDDYADVDAVIRGNYVVQARDLPLYALYRCGRFLNEICMRPLQAGELTGTLNAQPREAVQP